MYEHQAIHIMLVLSTDVNPQLKTNSCLKPEPCLPTHLHGAFRKGPSLHPLRQPSLHPIVFRPQKPMPSWHKRGEHPSRAYLSEHKIHHA